MVTTSSFLSARLGVGCDRRELGRLSSSDAGNDELHHMFEARRDERNGHTTVVDQERGALYRTTQGR
jgi:hypothetical protein